MLPDLVKEMIGAIGRKNTMMLIGTYYSRYVHVPMPEYIIQHPEHPLVQALEMEDAVALCEAFPSINITLPKLDMMVVDHRNQAMERMYLKDLRGVTHATRIKMIASVFDMTIQNVHNVLNKHINAKPQQYSLF